MKKFLILIIFSLLLSNIAHANSKEKIKKDGFVILEIGIGQLKQVDNIFLNQGFRRILKEKDLQSIDRVVVYQYKLRNI